MCLLHGRDVRGKVLLCAIVVRLGCNVAVKPNRMQDNISRERENELRKYGDEEEEGFHRVHISAQLFFHFWLFGF